jgi:hypothetical protein
VKPKTQDYSIFDKFDFERKPVGIKFLPYKPEGIERMPAPGILRRGIRRSASSRPEKDAARRTRTRPRASFFFIDQMKSRRRKIRTARARTKAA